MNTWRTATFQETVEPGDANKVPNGGEIYTRKSAAQSAGKSAETEGLGLGFSPKA